MARPVNQVLWDQWRQRMARQRASGLSIAEFCRQEQVSPHSFHVWKRKLGAPTCGRRSSRKAAPVRQARNGFTVVASRPRPRQAPADTERSAHAAEFLQLPLAPVRTSPWIELTLPEGAVVRLPQQNLAALVTVLRVLRGEPIASAPAEHGHA